MQSGRKRRRLWGASVLLCCVALAGCAEQTPERAVATVAKAAATPDEAPIVKASLNNGAAAPTVAPQDAAATAFNVSSILTPDRPLRHGDFLWNDEGVSAGPTSVVVDLKAQIVYVYRGGTEIGRSAILYGADDKPTPTGTFPILQKKKDHVSNLYGAPMPHMLRLTWDGVAIHGSDVEYGAATHGCVGVPDEFAAMLFKVAKVGDPVLVTNAWRTDVYGT